MDVYTSRDPVFGKADIGVWSDIGARLWKIRATRAASATGQRAVSETRAASARQGDLQGSIYHGNLHGVTRSNAGAQAQGQHRPAQQVEHKEGTGAEGDAEPRQTGYDETHGSEERAASTMLRRRLSEQGEE